MLDRASDLTLAGRAILTAALAMGLSFAAEAVVILSSGLAGVQDPGPDRVMAVLVQNAGLQAAAVIVIAGASLVGVLALLALYEAWPSLAGRFGAACGAAGLLLIAVGNVALWAGHRAVAPAYLAAAPGVDRQMLHATQMGVSALVAGLFTFSAGGLLAVAFVALGWSGRGLPARWRRLGRPASLLVGLLTGASLFLAPDPHLVRVLFVAGAVGVGWALRGPAGGEVPDGLPSTA